MGWLIRLSEILVKCLKICEDYRFKCIHSVWKVTYLMGSDPILCSMLFFFARSVFFFKQYSKYRRFSLHANTSMTWWLGCVCFTYFKMHVIYMYVSLYVIVKWRKCSFHPPYLVSDMIDPCRCSTDLFSEEHLICSETNRPLRNEALSLYINKSLMRNTC